MAAEMLVFALLAIGLGSGVVLFLAVRAESNRRERMARRDAEHAARRDTSRGGSRNPQADRTNRRR